MTTSEFDVGVIGGGPAGASLAAYLARAGVSCVVFEREVFPRPHVGESLVPSSTRVFDELDFLTTMEKAGFPHKYGAVWTARANSPVYQHNWAGLRAGSSTDVEFAERAQPGVGQDYTYHVDRGLFDDLLLRHARRFGATVHEGTLVRGADFSVPGHVVIHHVPCAGRTETRVRMVADASGRRTLLGNQLKWRIKDTIFDQYALHTWFTGFDRSSVSFDRLRDYIFVHFLPLTNSWIWQIPITAETTSIGVVTQKKHFAAAKGDLSAFFWDAIATRPKLHDALRAAHQVRPLKPEGDYSYAMKQLAGDRLVLIGDAGRFVDPIFSTGVSIALNSARFAHRDILAAVRTGDFRRESFATFESTIRRGTRNWYNFISLYYRLNVLFTAFIRDPRYRLDVLKLLQGDVYDEDEPAVLAEMRATVDEVERNPRHPWHGLLGDLTAHAFSPASVRPAPATRPGGV
jgi:flavin-dependent dehydrogenase